MKSRIDRRQFIKAAGFGAAVLAAPGCLIVGQRPSDRKAAEARTRLRAVMRSILPDL